TLLSASITLQPKRRPPITLCPTTAKSLSTHSVSIKGRPLLPPRRPASSARPWSSMRELWRQLGWRCAASGSALFQAARNRASRPYRSVARSICSLVLAGLRQPAAPASFDHLVGAGEQRWRHVNADGHCSLKIDYKLKLGRL